MGGVTLIRSGRESVYTAPQTFPLSELGPFRRASGWDDVDADVRAAAVAALPPSGAAAPGVPEVPAEVRRLIGEREQARTRKDWASADTLRQRILAWGWFGKRHQRGAGGGTSPQETVRKIDRAKPIGSDAECRARDYPVRWSRKSLAALMDSSASVLPTTNPLRMMLSRRFADPMKFPQNGCS